MSDAGDYADESALAAMHQMQQEQQQWLEELAADEAKRREFEDWIASTHRTNTHEPQQSY